MIDAGIQELQADERECLRRFRAKAAELRAAEPTLSRQFGSNLKVGVSRGEPAAGGQRAPRRPIPIRAPSSVIRVV